MNSLLCKFFLVFLFALCFFSPSPSYSEVIKSIVIEGNQRISDEAIKSKLSSKVGKPYSKDKVSNDVDQLFEMGLFYDIKVYKTFAKLRFVVVEKPLVSELTINGNKKIKEDDLKEIIQIEVGQALDISKVKQSLDQIFTLYISKGFYLAKINYEVSDLDKQSIKLTYNIQENNKVKIKKINLIGNSGLTDEFIKKRLVNKDQTMMSVLVGGGVFNDLGFEFDSQVIKDLYMNEGYLDASVKNSNVYLTPDREGIIIDFQIEEGDQYKLGQIKFSGDLLFTLDKLMDKLSSAEGEIFSRAKLQNDISSLQAMYGDLGYAFLNIEPRTVVNRANKIIDIDLNFDKGEKINFGQFSILGNHRTRDKVIRREMRIVEGELYNETNKILSMENIKRLGFFENVTFNQKVNPSNFNELDQEIVVEEREHTGALQAGASYGSGSGPAIYARVEKTNLFGLGQQIALIANIGRESFYTLNFSDPYFLDTNWFGGLELYKTIFDVLDQYEDNRTGGAIRFGHPVLPYTNAFIKYTLEDSDIELENNISQETRAVLGRRELGAEGILSSVTFSLEYDKRDDRWMPSKGLFFSSSVEYAGLFWGRDKKNYIETDLNLRFFIPIWQNVVLRNNFTFSRIDSLLDTGEVPFNDLYRLGGLNSLRGFDWYTVGQKDGNVVVGGKKQAFYNLELQFPVSTDAGLFGLIFYDIGMAKDVLSFDNLKSNYGLGLRWFTPFGPLRLEFGFPAMGRQSGDLPEFQFSFGVPF